MVRKINNFQDDNHINLYLFDLRKIKNINISCLEKEKKNFNGFLEKPTNFIKNLVYNNNKDIPIIIINPIFQKEENLYQSSLNDPEINRINFGDNDNSRNESLHNYFDNSKRNWNDRFNIGFIE